MGEQGQTGRPGRAHRLFLLGFAATLIAVPGACVSGEYSNPTREPDEEQHLSSTPEDVTQRDDGSVSKEAHRYYDQARRMVLRSEWGEAIILYHQAIALEPSYVEAYEDRAAAYHALGKHEEAIRDYARAIEIRETPLLYMERGHALLEVGRYLEADQDYHVALAAVPSFSAYIGVGDAHRAMGELEEAARNYSDAILLGPDDWRAYYYRGVCYFYLGQFQQALEDFERVIILRPRDASAYFARGAIRLLRGQCTDALGDFQIFAALSNDEDLLSQAQEYVDYLKVAAECEPPPDLSLSV